MDAKLRLILIAALLGSAAPSFGHHSFSAMYDTGQERVIEGVVTEFISRNPHSWLIVEIRNADGETERWDIEMGPRMMIARMPRAFEPGDKVMVIGNPGRNRPRALHLSGLYRADDDYVMRMDPRTGEPVGPEQPF